jgi:PIN domain nuclease of toxin-antitoxin system
LTGDSAIPEPTRNEVLSAQNQKFVSVASAWEIAIKFKLGKLPGTGPFVVELGSILDQQGFFALPITIRHGEAVRVLPLLHEDPFDRMLIAQALDERMVLIPNEAVFDAYGVARCW